MNIHNQRVVYSDNGSLTDISVEVNDFTGEHEIAAFIAADDFIYIGSPLPFNQKYIHMGTTKNANASVVSVQIWNGSAWKETVDIVDRTNVGGASLAKSGYISFKPDIDASSWVRMQRSADVTGLTGTSIYGFYWCRLKWSQNLTVELNPKHIGHRFNTDEDLHARYPALNNATLQGSFLANSTNWDAQTIQAAEEIINDLIERNIIISSAQLLDFNRFKFASVHKTAEIIYRGMEGGYADQMKLAANAYTKAMNMRQYYVDLNQNATLDDRERKDSGTTVMYR